MCISWVSATFSRSSYGSKAVKSSPSGALLRTEAQPAQGYGQIRRLCLRVSALLLFLRQQTINKNDLRLNNDGNILVRNLKSNFS